MAAVVADGGLIDVMNKRLPGHLDEREILTIFAQVCAGVAHMHYQRPPIAHRDLKVRGLALSPPQREHPLPSANTPCYPCDGA